MNPVIGHINCPHCGRTDATVHREKKGKVQALYYRCPDCGTIQCRYPKGQEFINKNARWIQPDDMAARDAAGDAAAAEARGEVAEFAHKKAAATRQEEKPAAPRRGLVDAISAAFNREII